MRLTIRVKPGARRPGVGGASAEALVVAVSARAVDGQATEAALTTLAKALGLRRRQVWLVTGATSRTKIVEVDVGPEQERALKDRVVQLLEANS